MDNRTYYYARVSSATQRLDRQILAFKNLGATDRDIVTDVASGKDMNRPGYQALKTTILREGDELTVLSLDRLGRSKDAIKDELKYFKDHKIRVKILDLPTTMIEFPEGQEWVADMVNNILIEVLGAVAQRERENTRIRQQLGYEAARKRGDTKFGRPSIKKPDNWASVYNDWRHKFITGEEAVKMTGLKKTTFYKLAEEQLHEDVIRDVKTGKRVNTAHIMREYCLSFPKAKELLDKLIAEGVIKDD